MLKPLTACLCLAATVLAGCHSATLRPTAAMASGQDRTFTVPVYGADTAGAHAAATRRCQQMALFPQLLRSDGARMVFECVSEVPGSRP